MPDVSTVGQSEWLGPRSLPPSAVHRAARCRPILVGHSEIRISTSKSPPSHLLNYIKMSAALKASPVKRWLGDKGTYPVLITCVVASGLCTFQCVRYLTGHPDVNWSKTNRQNTMKYDGETGADWKSHRRWIATRHENAVNKAKGL